MGFLIILKFPVLALVQLFDCRGEDEGSMGKIDMELFPLTFFAWFKYDGNFT